MLFLCLFSTHLSEPVSIDCLSWMSGDWSCQIWGGTFEENWTRARGGTMQGTGRLIKEDKTTMMEFMSIEPNKDGILVMWIIPGKLSKAEVRPVPFTLSTFEPSKVVWENPSNDFPSKITYTKKSNDSLECVIEGKTGQQPAREVFTFSRTTAK